jgi:hypothetical protein
MRSFDILVRIAVLMVVFIFFYFKIGNAFYEECNDLYFSEGWEHGLNGLERINAASQPIADLKPEIKSFDWVLLAEH